jgi:hypothetical protein
MRRRSYGWRALNDDARRPAEERRGDETALPSIAGDTCFRYASVINSGKGTAPRRLFDRFFPVGVEGAFP